jgi:Rha family phage regulatory protein
MMKVTTLFNQRLSMSSLEIAELCHKKHKNVIRDIEKMFNALKSEPANFSDVYVDTKGEKRKYYQLPKNETLCLITGYRTDIRMKVIERWQILENDHYNQNINVSFTQQINEIARKLDQIQAAGSQ